jgi:hypothetical protein
MNMIFLANGVRVERAKKPTDGEYDYALVVDTEEGPKVIAEFFGRCSAQIILPAENHANYVASLINNSQASKNAIR